jgi:formate dehydrogenase maturation protein FdhE
VNRKIPLPPFPSPAFAEAASRRQAPMEGKILGKLEELLEKPTHRIQQIKKKRPGYGEILDFYQKVKEAQDKAKTSLKIDPVLLKKEWKELLAKEGFSLIQKEDFPLDIEASVKLFQALCQIGKEANPHMAEQVRKIKEALDNKKIDLKNLLKEGVKEQKIERVADEFGLDISLFIFNSEQHQAFD